MYDALAAFIAALKNPLATSASIRAATQVYLSSWTDLINSVTGGNAAAFNTSPAAANFVATFNSFADGFDLYAKMPSSAYTFVAAAGAQNNFGTLITEFFQSLEDFASAGPI